MCSAPTCWEMSRMRRRKRKQRARAALASNELRKAISFIRHPLDRRQQSLDVDHLGFQPQPLRIHHHKLPDATDRVRRLDHLAAERIDELARRWVLGGWILLLVATFIPYPTAVLARYLPSGRGKEAAIFYGVVFLVLAIAFNLLWLVMRRGLVDHDADKEKIDSITRQYAGGPFLYAVQIAIAFFSAEASLVYSLVLAAFFAVPGLSNTTLSRS